MLSSPDLVVAAPSVSPLLRTAGVAGLGVAVPEGAVPNADIAANIGVDAAWIERRTGIRSRRHAAPGARLTDLAAAAARNALAAAGTEASAVDVVLVATLSADELTPNAAPQVAEAIGAHGAGAMDIGAACTGFISGVAAGAGLIESGRADRVLIVGAEIMSRHLDHRDRKTAMLFGDGAGAVVLTADADGGIGPVVLRSDGAAAAFIRADRATGLVRMDGHETFKRATAALIGATREVLARSGLTTDDVDLFVYHQANGRITSAVAEALDVTDGRVLDVIADIGNTSAASIPLALAEARQLGLLHPGARIVLGAVGAGFTWGAAVLEWGQA
jgi:3-oxoacyl-[acyl-carrier-protein] synthase III